MKKLYIYFIYCYFKRPTPRTGVLNKKNHGESECAFTLIYPNGIITYITYLQPVNPSLWAYGTKWFLLIMANLSSWARNVT